MIKRIVFLFIIIVVTHGISWGEPLSPDHFSFGVMPGFTVPVGTYSHIFQPGSTFTLNLSYNSRDFPLFIRGSGIYDFIPLVNDYSISLITFRADGGIVFHITPHITVSPFAGAGYFYSFLNADFHYYGSHPCGVLGFESHITLSESVTIGVNAGYRHFFGFHDDMNISVTGTLAVPGKRENVIEITPPSFNGILPVLLDYYADNPVGSIPVRNNSPGPVELKNISLYINNFTNEPRVTTLNMTVESRKILDADFFADFTKNILDLETKQETTAVIKLEYLTGGKKRRKKFSYPVTIYPRTMIEGNNPSHIAAFIYPDDPAVYSLSRTLKKSMEGYAFSDTYPQILTAMSIYNALTLYGIKQKDRELPGSEYKAIQYPGTTLAEKQGDAIDILILLCSLFECLDVKTALIQTPDICFFAFSLGCDPGSIKQIYTNLDNIILERDSTWVPMIFTPGEDGFFQAVEKGAEYWKEYNKEETAVLFPVNNHSQLYGGLRPVTQPGEPVLEFPGEDEMKEQTRIILEEYFYQDSTPKPLLLEVIKKSSSEDIRMMNSLAVLYARYTFYDKAVDILNSILLHEEYVPALINMGNIYFLKEEMKKARGYFDRAYEKDPIHPVILLNLARVNFVMENYGNAKENYKKLLSINPELAGQYDYLWSSGQKALLEAAKTERIKKVIWIEEKYTPTKMVCPI